jgi:hypothetical protein
MSVIVDVTCLYSVVKNIADRRINFGFLPPHGKSLAAGEELSIFGDVREAVFRGDRFGKRFGEYLENCLERDLLEIRKTPAVVLTDETTDDIKYLSLNNTTLGTSDPCWEGSVTV